MAKILVADDEDKIRSLIKKYAVFDNHIITEASNGMEAIELFSNNNFDLIKDEKELLEIKEIFTERLEKKKIEVSIKEKIDFENLLKLKVVSVDNYNYIFEYDDRRIQRRIQFYSNTKPKVNDNVYVSRDILEEDMLAYGHITNIEELSNKIIFIIERNDTKIYLKRYYG